MKPKLQKAYSYYGLGFPVVLQNVPMIKIRGEWVPDFDFEQVEDEMAIAVPLKPTRLTGNEIRFLRLRYQLSPSKFAQIFECSRPCVLKWEAYKDLQTNMAWSTEKDIRL